MSIVTEPNGRVKDILVVDDNPADLALTLAAFRQMGATSRITALSDGETAIAYLRRQGNHFDAPRPDLVMLDMNLPKISGAEVLTMMKADADLRQIPTVILSGSTSQIDIAQAYDCQVAAYIIKPPSLDKYFSAIRAIYELWFGQASLPPHANRT